MTDEVIAKIISILQQGMIEAKDVTIDFRTLELTVEDDWIILAEKECSK